VYRLLSTAAALWQVVSRTVTLAGGLGIALTLGLAASNQQLPRLFTSDPEVLLLMSGLMPVVVASQATNALAFAWDGVLFGAGGFK